MPTSLAGWRRLQNRLRMDSGPVPFDTGLEQARMTTTDNFTVIPEFNSGQALNLIQNVILNLIQDRLQMILAFVRMTTNVANVLDLYILKTNLFCYYKINESVIFGS